jgi:hypothetical protein
MLRLDNISRDMVESERKADDREKRIWIGVESECIGVKTISNEKGEWTK